MNNLKIIFFGTPDFVIPVLDQLSQSFSVVGVVTAPDKKAGRKQILTPTPVKSWALSHQIPVFIPLRINDVVQSLEQLQPDLIVVAAFGKIIPQVILEIPKFGALNIHPSLLPKYRGPSPIQNTILNGDQSSGVTIIKMDDKMDHGPVVFTKEISLSNKDNFETLSKKMFNEGAKLLSQIIPQYVEKKLKPLEQNHDLATFTKIITKEDGYFDINPPAGGPPNSQQLDRMIRAYYPWPTAWTRWNNKIVKFLPENIIQMEGKKAVKIEDFLRGYPTFPVRNL